MTASSSSAIGKVAAVMEALADLSRISDIARATGLPTSTVHRILQELVAIGWAREDTDRRYLLGARLLSLAGRASDASLLVHLGRPILHELCDRTGYAVHLAWRQGDTAVYLDKLEGRRSYHMRSRIGLSIPLHTTAIGKAILAAMPADEAREVLARAGTPRLTDRTITDPEVLLAHLEGVRGRGFAVDDEENEPQTRCVGAVVLDHRAVAVGGLSVSALTYDLDHERLQRIAPLVIRAAADLTAALGGRTAS